MPSPMGTKIFKTDTLHSFYILANFGYHKMLYDRVGAIPLRMLPIQSMYVIHASVWPWPSCPMGTKSFTNNLITNLDIIANFCPHQTLYDTVGTVPLCILLVQSTCVDTLKDIALTVSCDVRWGPKFIRVIKCLVLTFLQSLVPIKCRTIGSRPYPCLYSLYDPRPWYMQGYGLDPLKQCLMGIKIFKNDIILTF